MTAFEQVSSVSKVFRDTSAGYEARLITSDEERDERLETVCEDLSDSFDWTVLQRNGTEGVGGSSGFRFR